MMRTSDGYRAPRKQLAHRDTDDSFEGAMIQRREQSREMGRPRKYSDYDDRAYRRERDRSRSSRRSRRRRHRKYDDSDSDSDSTSDSASSSDEERRKKLSSRKKTLLTACLATITTIGAGNNIYQSTKAHEIRKKQMEDGKLSHDEVEELKRKGRKMDLISLGIGGVCLYNARMGWKRMEMQQKEAREAEREKEKERKHRH
ncbi:MAG: hypothetical protein Q9183_003743 [Haloplaca sp. 2 TL-2023]